MGAATREQQGTASGLLATSRVVSRSLSVAVAGAVFAAGDGTLAGVALAAHSHGAPLAPEQASALQATFISAFHVALVVCAAIAATGMFASLVRGKQERRAR